MVDEFYNYDRTALNYNREAHYTLVTLEDLIAHYEGKKDG